MALKPPINKNYCATVVEVKGINTLPNCDNVVSIGIFGNSVIVSKDTKVGDIGVFFPVETELSKEFLRKNNLYRHSELNEDSSKKGYFEDNGRIKAVKFRGHKSEGFFVPLFFLDHFGPPDLHVGDEFDFIGSTEICRKYVVTPQRVPGLAGGKRHNKKSVKISRLVENQFRLHYETAQLAKNLSRITPDTIISISAKFHGTSWVVGNVLTKRKLSWLEKLAKLLRVKVQESEYDVIFSSRKVIKNGFLNANSNSFYDFDIWKDIRDKIGDMLPQGISVYGEAVGYLPNGKCIQKGYHYGCRPSEYAIYIYRVTYTNPEGKVIELDWPTMRQFCKDYGLNPVHEYYYGPAGGAFSEWDQWNESWALHEKDPETWRSLFLDNLKNSYHFGMKDQMCRFCNSEVPSEGIVIRIDHLKESEAYKLKNFKFLERETKELDSGEINIEDTQ